MPQRTRRNKLNRKNGGGWTQGPPLSSNQYYLTEYKAYTDCYPMARPGAIQSNPNPELAQTPMAGGSRYRKSGGSSCREYFLTRGGSRNKKGGCGCAMRGGSRCREYFSTRGGSRGGRYGECPFSKCNTISCPYKGGKRRTNKRFIGGRYIVDTASSIGGDGPNVAPTISSIPCEAHRPMPINPHVPTDLVSAPESGIHFAGLSPAAVLKGGSRRSHQRRSRKRQNGGDSLAYTAPRAGYSFFPNIAQGQTLNPGQIPYNVVVPSDGGDSAKPCGPAMAQINKP